MRLQLDSPSSTAGPQAGAVSGVAARPDAARASRYGTGSGDSVSISSASSALGRLSSERAARVAQLSAAVQSGSYQVAGSLIAASILGHAGA